MHQWMNSYRAAMLCHNYIMVFGKAVLIFGAWKQMAALFRAGIKQLEVQAGSVFLRAWIQLCSVPSPWPGSLQLQSRPHNLGAALKKTQTNIQNTKPNKQNSRRIIHRGFVLIFFFLFNAIALFVLAPLGIQLLEFLWLVGTGLFPQERLLGWRGSGASSAALCAFGLPIFIISSSPLSWQCAFHHLQLFILPFSWLVSSPFPEVNLFSTPVLR